MLGTVISNLQRLVTWSTTLMSNVMKSMQQRLSKITGVLLALKIQYVNLLCQFALIAQKCKALVAQFTTLALSIKVALTTVKQTLTQIGSLLQTIVAQIRQLVTQAWKQGKSLVKTDTQDQSQK